MSKEAILNHGKLSVLIVEDEPRLRELLERAIGSWEFKVASARTAEEAIKLGAQAMPDIVLLDLNLPGMGGIELFEQLRARDKRLRVIVMTGFGDLDAAKQAIRLDVTDFLTKPCHLGELEVSLDRARKWLRRIDTGRIETSTTGDDSADAAATLEIMERRQILAALERNDGNRTATAIELGISRRTLQYRLSEYVEKGYLKE